MYPKASFIYPKALDRDFPAGKFIFCQLSGKLFPAGKISSEICIVFFSLSLATSQYFLLPNPSGLYAKRAVHKSGDCCTALRGIAPTLVPV